MSAAKARLVLALAGAGVPIDTLTISPERIGGEPALVQRTFMPWATQEQIDQGDAIIAAFDWSPGLDAAFAAEQARRAERDRAKGMLTAADPLAVATRAACYALMVSIQEARGKVNELVAWANAQGAAIASGEVSGGSGLTFGAVTVLAAAFDGVPSGKGVTCRISGGSDDATYDFAVKITLSNGRVLVMPCRLAVAADHE